MLQVNELIGFGVSENSVAISLSQVAFGGILNDVLVAPGSIQAGDLLVFHEQAGNGTSSIPTASVPSGFSIICNNSVVVAGSAGLRGVLSFKIADGSEASSSLSAMSGNAFETRAILVFRSDLGMLSATTASANGEATDGNPSSQTITASGGVSPLVVVSIYCSDSSINPRTMTPEKDGEASIGSIVYVAWKIYNSEPQDVSVDMDDEGFGNILQSCYIEIS